MSTRKENLHENAERKPKVTKSRKTIQENELSYQTIIELLENIQEVFYVLDHSWNFVYANKKMADLSDMKPQDIVGQNFWKLFPKNVGTIVERNFREAMDKREIKRFETGGTYTNLWFMITVVPSSEGIAVMGTDITERRKVEEAFKNSEKKFRLIVENSVDGINMLDLITGKYVFMSPAQIKLTGFTMEEINNISAEEAFERTHPDDREITITQQKKVAAGENVPGPVEYRWRVKSGEYRWFSDSRKLVRDEQGKAIALVGISRDITESKKAEHEILAQKIKAEQYLNIVGNIVLALDVQGNITLLNKKGYEILGYDEGELAGKSWTTCLPKDSLKNHWNAFETWVQGNSKTPGHYESPILTKEGKERIISWHNTEIQNEEGKIIGTLSSGEDITERKMLEEKTKQLFDAVQQERDRLSSLLNSITDEVWFADTNKKLTLANPSAIKEFMLDSLGTYDVENIAASFEVYRTDGSARPVEEAPPLRALKGEVLRNFEEIVKTPNSKELRYRQVSAAPVRDSKGNIIGSVSVVRDITELKQLQNRLQKYSEELEKLVEERTRQLKDSERLATIGATAGMVGHDIRNPLQAILSDTYLLKEELTPMPESKTKEAVAESLESIEKNIDYINKIVQDLQDYARPIAPTTKTLELEQVFDEVTFKKAIPSNIHASYNIEETAREIVSDSALLKRILANLVNNAVQAMPQGGELNVDAYREGNDILIVVRDTGGGIPEEFRAKLFTPLFTTKSKGQGFGLAVVKRLTEALGGKVTFETQEGKGTTFIVRLPQSPLRS